MKSNIPYAQFFNRCLSLVGGGCHISIEDGLYKAPSLKWLENEFNAYWFAFAGYHRLRYRGDGFNCRHWTRACILAANLCQAESTDAATNDVAVLEANVNLRKPLLGIDLQRHRLAMFLCDDNELYFYEPQTFRLCAAAPVVADAAVGFDSLRN